MRKEELEVEKVDVDELKKVALRCCELFFFFRELDRNQEAKFSFRERSVGWKFLLLICYSWTHAAAQADSASSQIISCHLIWGSAFVRNVE